jgi:hypothetical protein
MPDRHMAIQAGVLDRMSRMKRYDVIYFNHPSGVTIPRRGQYRYRSSYSFPGRLVCLIGRTNYSRILSQFRWNNLYMLHRHKGDMMAGAGQRADASCTNVKPEPIPGIRKQARSNQRLLHPVAQPWNSGSHAPACQSAACGSVLCYGALP